MQKKGVKMTPKMTQKMIQKWIKKGPKRVKNGGILENRPHFG